MWESGPNKKSKENPHNFNKKNVVRVAGHSPQNEECWFSSDGRQSIFEVGSHDKSCFFFALQPFFEAIYDQKAIPSLGASSGQWTSRSHPNWASAVLVRCFFVSTARREGSRSSWAKSAERLKKKEAGPNGVVRISSSQTWETQSYYKRHSNSAEAKCSVWEGPTSVIFKNGEEWTLWRS